MKLKTVEDIPSDWKRLTVRKKTTVEMRSCFGVERFKVPWQDAELVSDPEFDLIIIQPNGEEYPCKKDIFWDTYIPTSRNQFTGGMQYIKKATTQLVEIPEGFNVEIETLEGTLPVVTYPDFIAIGVQGELYANTREFFDQNLKVVD